MNIHYTIHTNFMGTPPTKSVRKLVPLSEYKGPVLVLTPKDNAAISILQGEIDSLEVELYKLGEYYLIRNNKMSCRHENNILTDMSVLESRITDLREQITQIKKERFNAIKASQGKQR